MKTLSMILTIILLTGCGLTQPNLQTGEDCWRYGVLSTPANTGRQTDTPIADIPTVDVDYETLGLKCDFVVPELSWSNRGTLIKRGCYNAADNTIYRLKLYGGQYDINEARCHALLGTYDNLCVGSYGLGKDESACVWNVTRKVARVD